MAIPQLELHFYDGKIAEASSLIASYNLRDLEQGYNKILPLIPPEKHNIVNNLNIIINDHRIYGRSKNCPNYDQSNDCYACELLFICFNILFDEQVKPEDFKDLLHIFLEQIDDMSTGICPPGRTTRLAQFILMSRY